MLERCRIGIQWIVVPLSLSALISGCNPTVRSPTELGPGTQVWLSEPGQLDVLVVVDSKESATAVRSDFRREFAAPLEQLFTGDRDGDGARDGAIATSLHLGIITSDLGVGVERFDEPGCGMTGDDGLLLARTDTGSECFGASVPFASYTADDFRPELLDEELGCVFDGIGEGCRFTQPLEAMLKALTPATSEIVFQPASRHGHGDTDNAGFLRPNSTLAVLIVSNEDDCSAGDPEVFNSDSTMYPEPMERCYWHPEALYGVERYADGLFAVRSMAQPLVLGVISGVPTDLIPPTADTTQWARILDDERMQEELRDDGTLRPSCVSEELGPATPPRRLVAASRRVAHRGGTAAIESLCGASVRGSLDESTQRIAGAIGSNCLPPSLPQPLEDGCELLETLPAGASKTCGELNGRETQPLWMGAAGATVCRVVPSSGEDSAGWFVDSTSPEVERVCAHLDPPRRIRIRGAAPGPGASLRLSCPMLRCSTDDDCKKLTGLGGKELFCDSSSELCRRSCTGDADCGPGWRCASGNDARRNVCLAGSGSSE